MSNKSSKGKSAIELQQDFSEVLKQIQRSHQKVFAQVNTALIDLYWHIGKTICHKVQAEAWGKGVVSELGRTTRRSSPVVKPQRKENTISISALQSNTHRENWIAKSMHRILNG
jgi:DUF1016 N-terminal domain